MNTVTVHGHEFYIQTFDWGPSSADAEKGVRALAAIVRTWTPEQAELAFKHLEDCEVGADECERGGDIVLQAEAEAFATATDGWFSIPETGHDLFLSVAGR